MTQTWNSINGVASLPGLHPDFDLQTVEEEDTGEKHQVLMLPEMSVLLLRHFFREQCLPGFLKFPNFLNPKILKFPEFPEFPAAG